jgi:hypothetical protein
VIEFIVSVLWALAAGGLRPGSGFGQKKLATGN